ncbi:MAG: HlyD family secretion protein [Hyphomicrobiaceae bacterium]|nr:HlyD family secretion protein [Hyphomicrobiaceae bacterium]
MALTIAGLGGYLISGSKLFGSGEKSETKSASAVDNGGGTAVAATSKTTWVAAAPGRVEPNAGAIRIGAPQIGRVADVLVAVNDKVEDGELLIRLDDAEYRAKLAAAETEAGARMRERDAANLSSSRADVRKAEDDVYDAERAVTGARIELDEMLRSRRSGEASSRDVDDARRRMTDARARLKRERVSVAKAQAKSNLPEPSRAESGLSAARSDVAIADALLDKTRIRAPKAGTVLEVHAKVGEIVAPSPELALIVIGDLSSLQVKAEVSESDISKIKIGQKAFVKTTAFPGQQFQGRVSAISPSLAAPKLGSRGPRRPTDVDVLEVTVDLDGQTPLLPGMRVDAFFREG